MAGLMELLPYDIFYYSNVHGKLPIFEYWYGVGNDTFRLWRLP
jgi:hypothetical protein